MLSRVFLFFSCFFLSLSGYTQDHSIARLWNELLLEGIRGDFARPTVHARNLFHCSAGMYDAWAVYDEEAEPYFLGNSVGGFEIPLIDFESNEEIKESRQKAISFVMYRLLRHRFLTSPGAFELFPRLDQLMDSLGYDRSNISVDYQNGDPAAMGNYIASKIIEFGFVDGSNEQLSYENTYYQELNDPLIIAREGNPDMTNPNRWQPITLDVFIDQSGNVIPFNTPDFLSPEWGDVVPFSLDSSDLTIKQRDGHEWKVYHDPGEPWYISDSLSLDDPYKWGFTMVAVWASHLGVAKDTIVDISPASIGNNPELPTTFEEFKNFYRFEKGGDASRGHALNPKTGEPYLPQMVPLSDYARVLAEFWADGPDSETPPGHWFTILNYVNYHPDLIKKFEGKGDLIDDLEWDVKTYFTLGGTMHDCAISAWGIKGYYDYVRPASAIRYMAEMGQSSDPNLPNYHPHGMPLIEGYVELVQAGDPLEGFAGRNIGEIKIFSWRGPSYVTDPDTTVADVGWILAKNWWPYQRPSFVTPPFAGYVSGHSTFSRAAAEVLTAITGDPYFPGGMGIFDAFKDEFLVFEDGPSQDLELQWATYRDASDQTSLSRIWGGIHPPVDDIPGRKIGLAIGLESFSKAKDLFYNDVDQDGFYSFEECVDDNATIYPGAPELCDGLDNDCDGEIDEDLELFTYYIDADNDGFGNENITIDTCINFAPEGYTIDFSDCNDNDAGTFPGAPDITDNEIDEDCSGRDASADAFIQYDVSNNFRLLVHYPENILTRLDIYNTIGQKVVSQKLDFRTDNYLFFETNNLINGNYFLILRDDENKILFRANTIILDN